MHLTDDIFLEDSMDQTLLKMGDWQEGYEYRLFFGTCKNL